MKLLKKLLKWTLSAFLVLILGLLIYGSIHQNSYDKKVEKDYRPTGKIVQLSKNKMHYQLIGDGDVTFVLETGLGENIDTWKRIKDSIAQIGRVFMYDRSGLGFSESNEEKRTTHQIAIELNELLTKENIPGPYILVGHSIGGAHIRYYTNLFPKDIIGLFLIDPSHEKMKDDLPPPSFLEKLTSYSLSNLSWSGIPFYLLPNPPHPTYKTSNSLKAYGNEWAAIDESISIFKSSNIDLSHLPIYIISATAQNGEYKKVALGLMEELMNHSKSDIKRHLIYEKPHHIHITDPELVIRSIREFKNRISSKETFKYENSDN